ncbi:META domain-containing protein [Longimicrobium sp.]|uniref:META domain-containing protein n=1 Tax=Longimicrobium sp. TaxID=2029185 RepID=UPI003B3A9B5E
MMRSLARYGRLLSLGAAFALAACAAPAAGPGGTAEQLAGTTWRLDQLNGQPAVALPGDGAPTLLFAADQPRVSGNGGCNQFNGQYTQSGEALRMGPLASTRRACVDEAGNRQETAYLRALESTTRFSATAEQLLLYAGDQVVARLWRNEGSTS